MNARRIPIGTHVIAGEGVHFRVWAPNCTHVQLVLEVDGRSMFHLNIEDDGYFSLFCAQAKPGMRYGYRLDGDQKVYPDPASRFQPDGPHGLSQLVDPSTFSWNDQHWKGVTLEGQVIYEMHIGTFTMEGTWESARQTLPQLADVGITLLEVMPVAEFPGKFGWGYDGVNLFAPTRLYGSPDDFRRFVDTAHSLGLGVILDVVYNHLGPDGNYLPAFARDYFSDRYKNEWGDPINFDGPNARPVREFFTSNAAYWIDEYHLDGLRLDATQQIFDASDVNILTEIGERARAAAPHRSIYIVAENEPQHARLVRPRKKGGYGLDAIWNDDFHHSAIVALTGHNEAYYSDYLGAPQEFVSAAKWGFLYQGQYYSWQKNRRGMPALDLEPARWVSYLENHDQVANSGRGARLCQLTSPGRLRAMTALFLLGPATPMLFQGQEFGSTRPFRYFADHNPELAKLVHEGRMKFMSQFQSLVDFEVLQQLPAPHDPAGFEQCKLDWAEREKNEAILALHRDLLRMRREDPVFRRPRHRGVDGAVLGPEAFVLRFFADDGMDRLLLVNLGRDLKLRETPEPLLAPPLDRRWQVTWSTEEGRYGGVGHARVETDCDNWCVPGEAAVVMAPATKTSD